MGDICDHADLERFIHSPEGVRLLLVVRDLLEGKTIVRVGFTNDVCALGIEITMHDGARFHCMQPELDVDALRYRYAATLEP